MIYLPNERPRDFRDGVLWGFLAGVASMALLTIVLLTKGWPA